MAPSTRIPKLSRHKGTGQAVVRLNGKDHYCGLWRSSAAQATYERLIARWLSHARQLPEEVTGAPLSVTQVIDLFWHRHVLTYYRRADGRPSSEQGCHRVALRHLRRLFGDTPASDFGPKRLMELRDRICAQTSRFGKTPARSTVNGYVKRIKACFKWAVAQELVPPGLYEGLRAVDGLRAGRSQATDPDPVRPVTRAQVEATLPHVSRQVAAMVELMWLTGMRLGEAVTMRTGDIDRAPPTWEYRPAHHKTAYRGRERVIPLGPQAQDVLRPFLKADPHACLFSPQEAERKRLERRRETSRSPLSDQQRAHRRARSRRCPPGDRYSTDAVRRAITRACEEADIEHWHPHQLRHTAATRFRREAGLEAARVLLGHSSPVVTEEHYAEVDRTKASELMARLG